ncbi:MAG: glucose-6-phosphate isomerase [Negativicutes bacterium]|nr:glucose-6-phosphate isomerase [Negativicutes bacterium]
MITPRDIEEFSFSVQEAAQAVDELRRTGLAKAHVSKDGLPEKVLFTRLPYIEAGNINNPESIRRLKEFGQSLRYQTDAVISFGIGGSFLGNKVIFDVHCGEFWNQLPPEARNGYPKLYFSGNNMDPRRTEELIALIRSEAAVKAAHRGQPYRIVLVVISKSGSTIDTMSTFMTVYQSLREDIYIKPEVVAVTDPAAGDHATLLGRLAAQQGWQRFAVPDGVGGRFSVFSEVGLITGVTVGFDIDAFLAGARSMDEACRSAALNENPALLNASLKYLAAVKYGRDIEVFMPYADYLKSTAEWYVQLLAESLGKRRDRAGREIFYGRTPTVAVGTTDMHAQTQQHQDGKKNKVLQFIRVANWPSNPSIPNAFPQAPALQDIAGIPLGEALDAALQANAAALTGDGRFNATITLPELSPFHLGELLYLLALSVAYEGELANVNAYDQPGVEAYKKFMHERLKQIKRRQ